MIGNNAAVGIHFQRSLTELRLVTLERKDARWSGAPACPLAEPPRQLEAVAAIRRFGKFLPTANCSSGRESIETTERTRAKWRTTAMKDAAFVGRDGQLPFAGRLGLERRFVCYNDPIDAEARQYPVRSRFRNRGETLPSSPKFRREWRRRTRERRRPVEWGCNR